MGLVFLVLSVTRPRPPLGQVLVGTLNHATCHVYLPKAFETLIHENVTHTFCLLCVKYIFFWFYPSVRFEAKERVRTCKDYVIGREITTVAVGTITSSKISPQLWLMVQSATRGKKFVCSRCQSVVLQIDQLIARL